MKYKKVNNLENKDHMFNYKFLELELLLFNQERIFKLNF